VSELPLEIGKFYSGPYGWEVYVVHPQGGLTTLFRGTEQECEEFVRTAGPTTTLRKLFGPEVVEP
jgi:hypothetical protein